MAEVGYVMTHQHAQERHDFPLCLSERMKTLVRFKLPKWSESELVLACHELIRFMLLAMAGVDKKKWVPIDERLDQLWHFFILETEEYAKLCERIAPGRFLHHRPVIPGEEVLDVEARISDDLTWVASYLENFGPFTPETVTYWKAADRIRRHMNWSIDELNTFCRGLSKFASSESHADAPQKALLM